MTIGTLTLYIGLVALILTGLTVWLAKHKSVWMTFLQHFCGSLFVFSGFVKVIDPLGTAYKMEQYFAEFQSTFADTWFSFVAPMFPWLAGHSELFSVVMIVFEIALGVMLLIGAWPRLTSWAFFLLVLFFTFLTGFTYLTGYVPDGVNFFEFSKWGPYVKTNMKVTDCGCFGDFLKLEPKVSFMKDLVLLVPAVLFLLFTDRMHQFFTARQRTWIVGGVSLAMLVYGWSNYVWDLPDVDFRPFKVGVNVAERKALEEEAAANIEIIAYRARNKQTGEVVEIPFEQYLAEYKNYPKEAWDLEQITSEPAIEPTKISDFELSNLAGEDMTEHILTNPNYHFMVVAYQLWYDTRYEPVTVQDSIFTADTVVTFAADGPADTALVRRFARIETRTEQRPVYVFDPDYLERYTKYLNPLLAKAKEEGYEVYVVTGYADPAVIEAFAAQTGSRWPFYLADDILLKTIIRSNPGLVLWRNGTIVGKWHWRQLPDWETLKDRYLHPTQ